MGSTDWSYNNILSKMGFGAVGHLMTTEMGDAELPKEPMIDVENLDFSGPSANAQLLEQMSQDATMKAGGGMMNMDEMTRPLGYAAGGPIPRNKFDALMAEFDTPENRAGPGEPVGLEKIIAEKYAVDPRHTLPTNFPVDSKFLAREMGGDQGSGLMDEATTFEILNMKLKLLRAADSLAEMDRIQALSPYEILEEVTAMENKK